MSFVIMLSAAAAIAVIISWGALIGFALGVSATLTAAAITGAAGDVEEDFDQGGRKEQ